MAIVRGEAHTLTVQCSGATAPMSGTIDGAALDTAPVLVAGTLDSYELALTATELDVATAYVLLTDAGGAEYGFTVDTSEPAVIAAAVAAAVPTLIEITAAVPTVEDIDLELTTNHGSGEWGPADGEGTLNLVYRVELDSDGDGIPDTPIVGLAGVRCTLTSDLAGQVPVGSVKTTDVLGYCTWRGLVAGTYYIWREAAGYSFTDPDTEEVSA